MFTNETFRTATEMFLQDQPVDDFVYEGSVGFDALVYFLADMSIAFGKSGKIPLVLSV